MKKIFLIAFALTSTSAVAYDNYVGLRLHQNQHMAFKYASNTFDHKMTGDATGFGIYVGNRLTDNVKIEFETSYTGADFDYSGHKFDYSIWSNNINVYVSKNYENVIEPYVGGGVGLAGVWGTVMGDTDCDFKLSYALLTGVIFALNDRIDLNMGIKYQNYGKLSHGGGATTRIDTLDFHIGAAYKFAI